MTNTTNFIPDNLWDKMFTDRSVRTAITTESHLFFFHFYLADYVTYHTAPFQKEIFALTEDENTKNIFIVAFRGSGKSTIVTTSYPLWAILGKQQKKFVLILCQTKAQAKQHMMNLRRELENNTLLKNDLGPFKEETEEWGSGSLVFSNSNARITVASIEQSIRGLRHGPYRPDLVICDDIEDVASAKTREGRDKTYDLLTSEVIPAGSPNMKLVVVGNLLHEDSLLMRVKEQIEKGYLSGVFKAYPLVDKNENILWLGKYPDKDSIEAERKKIGNENAWQREYMLKILPTDDQVVRREWIHYYDALPEARFLAVSIIGVDLAISQKDTADYTSIVTVNSYIDDNGKLSLYVLPNPVNKRMGFPETIAAIKKQHDALWSTYHDVRVLVEKVQYQQAVVDSLNSSGLYRVKGVPVNADKRTRLSICAGMIESGCIRFHKLGNKDLVDQLVGFGVEKHEDLVDALTIIIPQAISWHINRPRITYA